MTKNLLFLPVLFGGGAQADIKDDLIAKAYANTVAIHRDQSPSSGYRIDRLVLSAAHSNFAPTDYFTSAASVSKFFGLYAKKPNDAIPLEDLPSDESTHPSFPA